MHKLLINTSMLVMLGAAASGVGGEQLSLWRDTAAKQAILRFVERVTDPESLDFVPVEERIATFDNDGTLWSEKPAYFQLAFAVDRVKELAAEHPQWKEQQPFKAVLDNDRDAIAHFGEQDLLQLVMASHAGMTVDAFQQIAKQWLASARHPRFDRPYHELVFQPMLELLGYLRQNGFKTYIVSGGGIDFLRVFAPDVYGVPPEQVIGSSIKTRWDASSTPPTLVREPEMDFLDDKQGKPIAIQRFIGRRPILAFGNSDGDLQMLQWTATNKRTSLCLLLHHTDETREWAYDRDSSVGRLDRALDEARGRRWIVVDMRQDWLTVYPFHEIAP